MRVSYAYGKHEDGELCVSYECPSPDDEAVVSGEVTQLDRDTRKIVMSERMAGEGKPEYTVEVGLAQDAEIEE